MAKCHVGVGLLLAVCAVSDSQLLPTENVLSLKPLVLSVSNFASPEECQKVLERLAECHQGSWSACKEQRSALHNKTKPQTDGKSERPLRISTSFTLGLDGELDETVDSLLRRAHQIARHPITHGEGVQVASYHAGDYYGFHHDSLSRRATFLLYLTDIEPGDGGETIFPLLRAPGVPADTEAPLPPAVSGHDREFGGFKVERKEEIGPYCESDFYLKVRPEAGKALLFYSYGPDYEMDNHAFHGACPLLRGHKAIFQRWMRFNKNSLYDKAEDAIRRVRTELGQDAHLPLGELETTSTTTTRPQRLGRGTAEQVAPDGTPFEL